MLPSVRGCWKAIRLPHRGSARRAARTHHRDRSRVLLLMAASACGGDSAETAPDFTLPSAFGSSVSLSRVLSEHDSAVIVFYRGSF